MASPAVVCLAAAGGTLGAAVAISGVALSREAPTGERDSNARPSHVQELTAGFVSLFGQAHTGSLVAIQAVHCFAIGALGVAVIQLALAELEVGSIGLGLLEGALAAGGIIGGVVALGRATSHCTDRSVRLGAILWAVPFCPIVAVLDPVAAITGLAVAGVGNVLLDVAVYTHIQETAAESVLARTVAALQSVAVAAVGLGSLVGGFSLSLLGTGPTLVGIGLVVLAAVACVLRLGERASEAPRRPALVRGG
jgi:hypothetical protein